MADVPRATPVTMPVPDPTVATPVLLLTQVPPEDPLVNVEVVPMHKLKLPVVVPGDGLTETTLVAEEVQPP